MFNKKKYKLLAPMPKKDGGSWWMHCGTMYEGKEPGSFNLFVDAVPTSTKDNKMMFHIREYTEDDFRESRERAERRNSSGGGSLPSGFSSSSSGSSRSSSYAARGTLARSTADASPLLTGPDLPLQYGGGPGMGDAQDQPPF